MSVTKLAVPLFVLTVLLAIAQSIWAYPILPSQVFSHFKLSGLAEASVPKEQFVAYSVLVLLLVAVLVVTTSSALRRLPAKFIRIPNWEYWLSPELRPATLALLTSRIFLIGAAKVTLLLVLCHYIIGANLAGSSEINPVLLISLIVTFLGVKIALALELHNRFRKIPSPRMFRRQPVSR